MSALAVDPKHIVRLSARLRKEGGRKKKKSLNLTAIVIFGPEGEGEPGEFLLISPPFREKEKRKGKIVSPLHPGSTGNNT